MIYSLAGIAVCRHCVTHLISNVCSVLCRKRQALDFLSLYCRLCLSKMHGFTFRNPSYFIGLQLAVILQGHEVAVNRMVCHGGTAKRLRCCALPLKISMRFNANAKITVQYTELLHQLKVYICVIIYFF
jgi:hypothetical protein